MIPASSSAASGGEFVEHRKTDGEHESGVRHYHPIRSGGGIVKLLTLFGGCEDWLLWRLR